MIRTKANLAPFLLSREPAERSKPEGDESSGSPLSLTALRANGYFRLYAFHMLKIADAVYEFGVVDEGIAVFLNGFDLVAAFFFRRIDRIGLVPLA